MSFLKTIIFLSLFNILLGQSWMQKQRFERKFNQAVSSYDNGKYENCETILREILSEDLGVYKEATLLLLMKTHIGLNKFENAKQSAKQFLLEFPQSNYMPNIMGSLGDLYINESNYSSAYRMYHRVLDLSTSDEYKEKIHKKLFRLVQFELPSALIEELIIISNSVESQNIHLIAQANIDLLNGRPDDAALALSKITTASLPKIYNTFFDSLLKASYRLPSSTLTIA